MSKVKWKAGTLTAPVPPALVSCGDGDRDNLITVAWTGIICSDPPKTYVSIRPERYSYDIIKNSGEFVLNLTPSSLIAACDWCGIHTGRKVDKFKKWNLTKVPAANISVPLIDECPLSLECKVFDVVELGTHHKFLADIVGVTVNEDLLDKTGKLCLDRANLAAFAHGEYFELGKSLGKFGFSVKKKKKKNPQKKPTQKTNKKKGE